MAIRGWWRTPILAPLRLPRSVRWWRPSPVVVAAWRSRRPTVSTAIHRTVVVAIATVVRPVGIPLIRTHAYRSTCWSGREV
jgi:hypothetical protein